MQPQSGPRHLVADVEVALNGRDFVQLPQPVDIYMHGTLVVGFVFWGSVSDYGSGACLTRRFLPFPLPTPLRVALGHTALTARAHVRPCRWTYQLNLAGRLYLQLAYGDVIRTTYLENVRDPVAAAAVLIADGAGLVFLCSSLSVTHSCVRARLDAAQDRVSKEGGGASAGQWQWRGHRWWIWQQRWSAGTFCTAPVGTAATRRVH